MLRCNNGKRLVRAPKVYIRDSGLTHALCCEVDLVFERGGAVEMAIEIQRSTSPTLSRGFNSAREVLKPRSTYLVHGGIETWPMAEGTTAIALADLMRKLVKS